ncbi:MAG: lycopene beta-cyclase CrtY [Sphingomonadaceae bacterium]|nr:lycopene beta-cyclase CrtY [Sphingomonadaceae bacterium]
MVSGGRCDLAIVGGGLAGGLIALAARRARPDARVLLIEAGDQLGGNHIWSWFESDIAAADRPLIEGFASAVWDGYDVAFPGYRRTLATGYRSMRSEQFDAVLRDLLPSDAILTGRAVRALTPTSVTLADGTAIAAGGVIDARGGGDLAALELGWQKFVGVEYRLAAPHGLERPVVMDASVEQIDGYRFIYLLPFAEDCIFIEDTYYSDTPAIDRDALRARIEAYAAGRGWRIAAFLREEAAALPVVLGGDFAKLWGGDGVAKAGVRAGLFQPMTGYSLPDAVRTASLVATLGDWRGAALHDALRSHARRAWTARGYYRLLGRMLFRAAAPHERRRVFERFYGLDASLIERFYAARSRFADKARILSGRPPVPILRAVKALAA